MEHWTTEHRGRTGVVRNYASIYDPNVRAQAEMISRGHVTNGPVIMLPDAHLGKGAAVGTAIHTVGGIYPAAVGVDIGCGMQAVRTSIKAADLDKGSRIILRQELAKRVPSGVGHGRPEPHELWNSDSSGVRYTIEAMHPARELTAAQQAGTLGAGNHFAEYSEDEEGLVWAVVHSGSRGFGNQLAVYHIKRAQELAELYHVDLEHRDLAFLPDGTPGFDSYIDDLQLAQGYAHLNRSIMMFEMLSALELVAAGYEMYTKFDCHHNYTVPFNGGWLSRKGAIDANAGVLGIIPGSMGTDSYVVQGKGNRDALFTAPHGAGRVSPRGRPGNAKRAATGAYARFTVDEFKQRMTERGVIWQDRDADNLLDESPMVYKPIEQVIADAADLVKVRHTLRQIVNYKGL